MNSTALTPIVIPCNLHFHAFLEMIQLTSLGWTFLSIRTHCLWPKDSSIGRSLCWSLPVLINGIHSFFYYHLLIPHIHGSLVFTWNKHFTICWQIPSHTLTMKDDRWGPRQKLIYSVPDIRASNSNYHHSLIRYEVDTPLNEKYSWYANLPEVHCRIRSSNVTHDAEATTSIIQ